MTRILVICAALLGLSACGGEPGLMLMGGSLASLTYSKKTLVDHAVSGYTKEDCSILHTANNEPYCQPPGLTEREKVAYMASTMYCYRTLGGVNCYDRPDYMASSQTHVVFSDTLIEPLESDALASRSETWFMSSAIAPTTRGNTTVVPSSVSSCKVRVAFSEPGF